MEPYEKRTRKKEGAPHLVARARFERGTEPDIGPLRGVGYGCATAPLVGGREPESAC